MTQQSQMMKWMNKRVILLKQSVPLIPNIQTAHPIINMT